MKTLKYLSDTQLSSFENNGFLVIDQFLTPDELTSAKEDIDRVCSEQSDLTEDHAGFNLEKADGYEVYDREAPIKGPGIFRKIQCALFHVPALQDIFTSQKMLDCMEDIMGPDIYYHSSKVMFKPPGGAAKPWHQDAAYWPDYEPRQVTIWIAIDDATEKNGCVWAIPGSHQRGHVSHVGGELQVEESNLDLDIAVPVPVKPGGLLIFHSLVLHMSHKNNSDRPRRAIICDYDPEPNAAIDVPRDQALITERHVGLQPDSVWPLRIHEGAEA